MTFHRVLLLLVLVTGCVEEVGSTSALDVSSTDDALIGVQGTPRAPCDSSSSACVDVYIVAHQDDDLLFMNPDIERSIQSGNQVVVVHVTAGNVRDKTWNDATENRYWANRERGNLRALAQMASPGVSWTWSAPLYGSRYVAQYSRPNLTSIYIRIDDPGTDTLWSAPTSTSRQMPNIFLYSDVITLPPPPHQPPTIWMFSHADLTATLVGILRGVNATSVSMQDASTLYNSVLGGPDGIGLTDYSSHYSVALFSLEAAAQYQAQVATPVRLRMYRDYTLAQERNNLATAESTRKYQLFGYYRTWDCAMTDETLCGSDTTICDSTHHCPDYPWAYSRMIDSRSVVGTEALNGRIALTSGSKVPVCLAISGQTVTTAPCGNAPSWTIGFRNTIQLAGTKSCLHKTKTGTIELATCPPAVAGDANFVFFLMSNGQIRPLETPSNIFLPAGSGTCLDASGGVVTSALCRRQCVNAVSGAIVACSDDATGSCIDDQQCQPTQACLVEGYDIARCWGRAAGLAATTEDWTLLFDPPYQRTGEFSNTTEVVTAATYYRTLAIGNRNVCVRRATGVFCANSVGGVVQPAIQLTSEFADSDGWYPDENGSTVQAVWDPATSSTIACGRGYYGASCGNLGTSSFSTGLGWNAGPYYYDSIRYVDINRDGRTDICGRGYYGIECALSTGQTINASSLWTSEFNSTWNVNGVGDTVQFADVDGDGYRDVCGRSPSGLYCASQQPGYSSFQNAHYWSFDNDRRLTGDSGAGLSPDFSNTDSGAFAGSNRFSSYPAYYGSLKLVDVNKDGFADVCARGELGMFCALSMGHSFERKREMLPRAEDFTDSSGWGDPSDGSTMTFGDLDGDNRVDMCGRGYYGVVCASGY